MLVDEAGFYQLPAAVRTWAPRGQTPVLRAPLNYGNLSAILWQPLCHQWHPSEPGSSTCVSLSSRSAERKSWDFFATSCGRHVLREARPAGGTSCGRHVLQEISGKLTIVEADDRLGWTSGPPGTNGQRISCRGGVPAPSTGARPHLKGLPGYAPDLNPDEGGWNWLKNVEMKNLCCRGLDHLKTKLRKAKEQLKRRSSFATRPRSSRAFSERSD